MSHGLTEPTRGQGRGWALTGRGIAAIDGRSRIPVVDAPDPGTPRPDRRDALFRRSGAASSPALTGARAGRAAATASQPAA